MVVCQKSAKELSSFNQLGSFLFREIVKIGDSKQLIGGKINGKL